MKMDTVEIKEYKTKFAKGNHPMIFVNGKSLDELLWAQIGEENLLGLVPAITWLWDDEEQKIAIERLSNETVGSTVVPILVCPDDADFSCTVLIVEVELSDKTVKWCRFGIDQSHQKEIGTTVVWFKNSPVYEFIKMNYFEFRDNFIHVAKSN